MSERLEDHFKDCGDLCLAALAHAGVLLGAGSLGCTPVVARPTRNTLVDVAHSTLLRQRAERSPIHAGVSIGKAIQFAALMLIMAIEIVEGTDGP